MYRWIMIVESGDLVAKTSQKNWILKERLIKMLSICPLSSGFIEWLNLLEVVLLHYLIQIFESWYFWNLLLTCFSVNPVIIVVKLSIIKILMIFLIEYYCRVALFDKNSYICTRVDKKPCQLFNKKSFDTEDFVTFCWKVIFLPIT